jgi:hypothetical protein
MGAVGLWAGPFCAHLHALDKSDGSASVPIQDRSEVSQSGITWTFDHPVKSGQFINGDWWVVGPVTVVRVSPKPTTGPLEGEVTFRAAVKDEVKDVKGAMNFILGFVPPQLITNENDNRMRNGSMVITKFGPHQGYDSRSTTYDPSVSITYPYKLDANRTLISTISEAYPITDSFCHPINWHSEKQQRTLLKVAAVLTCLAIEPPADAFRPPYAGTDKTIYQSGNLKWNLLPNLKLENMDSYFQKPWFGAGEVATWQDFENYFQPVFLYHYGGTNFDYVNSYLEPAENQPMAETACYGREDSRLVSIASLMVLLDVPKEQKKKLVYGLVQRGIDLSGDFKAGTEQDPDRTEWTQSGLKWPILFASLMLDKPEIRQFPVIVPFHEDVATYYGTGWCGQTALWRIVWHDHLIDSAEERSPEQMLPNDHISDHYRSYGSSGKAYLGTALAARLLKGIKIWDHDAFFDYCDRWMDDDPYKANRGTQPKPVWETTTWEPFVNAMWVAYRKTAPEQEMAGNNVKSEWDKQADGWHIKWIPNPKPDPKDVTAHLAAIHNAFPAVYATATPAPVLLAAPSAAPLATSPVTPAPAPATPAPITQ